MIHLSILVLALTFGTASIQAEELPVRMTFSGSGTLLAPPVNLVSGGNSAVVDVSNTGDGSLGPFTQREVSAAGLKPTGFGCAGSNSTEFATAAGAGVFRFQDGSLLTYKMTAGTTCVNFTAGSASNIFTEQITGGTGQFKNASGTLTVVVPASYPILFDSTGQPVLIVLPSGEVTGTIVLSQ